MGGVFNLLGRDASMSGRTKIWSLVLAKAKLRPWLGYGFEAFWLGEQGVSIDIKPALGFSPSHAHSGYLDLVLYLGIVGLMPIVICLVVKGVQAVRQALQAQCAADIWPLTYLTLFSVFNLVESHMFQNKKIMWVLFVAVVCDMRSLRANTETES